MVSCENLLGEHSEYYNTVSESALKNLKNSGRKIYRSGGSLFTNPFKSDTEKMEHLEEMLKRYSDNGIPDMKHLPLSGANKMNHLRASSLSISGNPIHPVTSAASQTSSFLSTAAKTSLSTTDLHHLNHSSPNINSGPAGCSPPILTSTSFDATCDSNYYLEPEWRSIVDNSETLPDRVQSQNEAIWELLKTEVFYIGQLKLIRDVFVACLLNLQNEGLLMEVSKLFSFNSFFSRTIVLLTARATIVLPT